ncbi:MAG: hypothetical protein GWP08_09515 [Nitrospiraceae bacterium]|nr:hypothetical protein [Nitrospiraceae bacterium]
MNSIERTLTALDFQQPDRVPIDVWLSNGFKKRAGLAEAEAMAAFLDAHDVDLRYIEGPRYAGPPLRDEPDGSSEDIWGVGRRAIVASVQGGEEQYREVAASPLASAESPEDVDNYGHWPSPDWFDYSGIEAQCEAARRGGRVVVFVGDRMNRVAQLKPAMYIRGMEQILMDMGLNPEVAHAIFARIRAFYLAYAERIFEAANGKLDILLMGDDFGTQRGPMIAPAMWSEFLGQGFKDYATLAHAYGLRVMHHTCGAVRPLIPLMLQRGLDILQSVQPEAADMDPAQLKADFGKRLAFHGGMSIQQTLPFGSPEEVRAEVRDRVEALAPGGGYILCTAHNVQADTSVENVEALLSAYAEYGRYA